MPEAKSLETVTGRSRAFSVAPFVVLGCLLGLALLPFLALVWISLSAQSDVWPHLVSYVLPRTVWQTAFLLFGVALGTAILGAGTAWLTTMCEFPGRRVFSWALVLPLAVPTYIAAYTHVEFFDFTGPLQNIVRYLGGFSSSRDYWFPDIRSLGGAVFIFSLVLYPYVYLTSRLIFAMQGASALDVSRSLGANPTRMFLKIGLPLARPALAAGIALALMETLNDIGAVEILGVRTLSFAVFETWLNRDSLAGAVQLAMLTLLLVALLIWLERLARRRRSYASASGEKRPARLLLAPARQMLSFAACAFPLIFGLGVPLWILGTYATKRLGQLVQPELLNAAGNSVLLSASTATLATFIAYGILQYARLTRVRGIGAIGRVASLGYAVPGIVLAIGLLIPLASFDNWLDGHLRDWFGISSGLLLSGTILIVIYACTLRFLAIAYGTIETGFSKLSTTVDMAASALGRTSTQIAWQVHRPVLARALGAAFLLVFVDTMKELSATLLLRPFDFETLATFVYDRSSQSALEDAALAALIIVLIGLLPVFALSRLSEQK